MTSNLTSNLGYNETVFDHLKEHDFFSISTSEAKWRNKLKKLEEQYPDEVKCIVRNDDGSVFYHVPESFVTIRKPKHVVLTEEQIAERTARLKAAREAKHGG